MPAWCRLLSDQRYQISDARLPPVPPDLRQCGADAGMTPGKEQVQPPGGLAALKLAQCQHQEMQMSHGHTFWSTCHSRRYRLGTTEDQEWQQVSCSLTAP